MNERRHLDLFSGIGGFALAAERAGWKTIGFAETDKFCSRVLARHWPTVKNYGDVRNVRNVRADLVTGGFPCQPFSLAAGQRRGKDDNRYLWPEMLRVVKESQPTWVLAENVPGIIDLALDQVLSDLETIGYETGTLVIPACAVGAPHRRDRVWIVAHSESEGLEGSIATGRARPARCSAQRSNLDVSDTYGKQAIRTTNQWEEHRNWPAEPDVGRVAHGIPYRVDRLRSLGNAIVPQVAEVILRQMI